MKLRNYRLLKNSIFMMIKKKKNKDTKEDVEKAVKLIIALHLEVLQELSKQ